MKKISQVFTNFSESEKSAGFLLIACSILSLVASNTPGGHTYVDVWEKTILSKPLHFWINDVLMTIFFLLVGLEIKREVFAGELSDLRSSMLPVCAAIGGMCIPALIHFSLNYGTEMQRGAGIPMATDIAFSLAILSALGKRIPVSLKIFLTALAIIDDLGAIIIIAVFYSSDISFNFLLGSLAMCIPLIILKRQKINRPEPYLIPGAVMWYFMYKSGIHPTIAGVLIAFLLPFSKEGLSSLSHRLQGALHKPVAFFILPLFALANTAIVFPQQWSAELFSGNSLGIILGLFVGKPLGIFFFSWLGLTIGIARLPENIKKSHLFYVGILAGIGFTMSIFIALLAFDNPGIVVDSKIAILAGSLISGLVGFLALRFIPFSSDSPSR